MRIAIFGAGGAGGYFGARLANAGEEVVFVARGKHLQAIRTQGLRVATPSGEMVIRSAQATDNPTEVGAVDVIVVGVKAEQVADAAQAMGPMIGPNTCVLPLQNGVEASAQLAAVLGAEHVLGGLCGTISWVTGPGQIRNIGEVNFVKFGELDNQSRERTERLREAFDRAGVTVEIPVNIHQALWEKFLFIVSFGGVGVIARAPIGVIRTVPETRQMLKRCMEEICLVAKGSKIPMANTIVGNTMEFVDSLPANGTTSLQRDIADGKPSELDAWNGAVARMGKEVGVATPLHEFIYHSLQPLELQARGKVQFPA